MKNIVKKEEGAVLVEFVLILPIILMITFLTVDYARYILLQQKVIKVSYVLADAITMSIPIEPTTTAADVASDATYMREELLNDPDANNTDLIDAVPTMVQPFSGTDVQVVVSHVYNDGAGPVLTWQYDENSRSFNNVGAGDSVVGTVGNFDDNTSATLPASIAGAMQLEESIIVVETIARYRPVTPALGGLGISFLSESDVRYTAYMQSRFGDLGAIWNINCRTNIECASAP